MWGKLGKFLRLSRAEQALFMEAALALARARLMLATRPFQQIAARLGQPSGSAKGRKSLMQAP